MSPSDVSTCVFCWARSGWDSVLIETMAIEDVEILS